jgi:hypothetical protein
MALSQHEVAQANMLQLSILEHAQFFYHNDFTHQSAFDHPAFV